MPKKYIAIAGNMGTGKSSLVEFLCRHFGLKPFYEPFETNPYLEDFYKEMKVWAFHSQMYFLSEKYKIHRALEQYPEPVIQDRSIYEDAEVYAENCYRQGHMSQRDYEVYRNFYQTIAGAIRPPDLLIYLKCSMPMTRKRIAGRGREMESTIPEDYLRSLNKLYDRWINGFQRCPVMIYRTDKLDYLSDFIHQRELLEEIGERLSL